MQLSVKDLRDELFAVQDAQSQLRAVADSLEQAAKRLQAAKHHRMAATRASAEHWRNEIRKEAEFLNRWIAGAELALVSIPEAP